MCAVVYSGISIAELKDPTAPVYYQSETNRDNHPDQQENLVLSAIWVSKKNKRAIINGLTVRQGEQFLTDIKLIKILKDSVLIQKNGRTRQLFLLAHSYKSRILQKQSK